MMGFFVLVLRMLIGVDFFGFYEGFIVDGVVVMLLSEVEDVFVNAILIVSLFSMFFFSMVVIVIVLFFLFVGCLFMNLVGSFVILFYVCGNVGDGFGD